MTKPIFNEQIKPTILEQLSKAKKSILVVVAWFNDKDIFELLLKKATDSNVLIKIILSEEDEEDTVNAELPFQKLLDVNENIYIFKIPKDAVMVHQKFCIVDGKNCISGSYNWTFGASYKNLENVILVENDEKVCKPFIKEFDRIFDEYCKPIINTSTKKLQELFHLLQNSIKHGNIRLAINVDKVVKDIKSKFLIPDNINTESFDTFNDPITIDSDEELIMKWWTLLPKNWKTFFLKNYLKVESIYIDVFAIKNLFTATENLIIPKDAVQNIFAFSGIKNLSFIRSIEANSCKLLTLNNIENFSKLTNLVLRGNRLFSLHIINELPSLEKIDVCENDISKIDYLTENHSVKEFHFMNNPCTSLEGIQNLKSLEYFSCDDRFAKFPNEIKRLTDLGLKNQTRDNGWRIYGALCYKKKQA